MTVGAYRGGPNKKKILPVDFAACIQQQQKGKSLENQKIKSADVLYCACLFYSWDSGLLTQSLLYFECNRKPNAHLTV